MKKLASMKQEVQSHESGLYFCAVFLVLHPFHFLGGGGNANTTWNRQLIVLAVVFLLLTSTSILQLDYWLNNNSTTIGTNIIRYWK